MELPSAGRTQTGLRKILWTMLAVCVLVICSLTTVSGQALTPPNFNLAVGRKIEATATCGVGVTEAELFCKLTGANPDKEDVIGEFEVIQGQLCDYCDVREPSRSHQPEHAVDGTERWWQSPPLSRGLQFNEVNLTISLGQEFHVAYVFIKMANSPRPGVFALERSKDYGKTWQPWQYFADTPSDCHAFFGSVGYSPTIMRDDSVICTSEYSKVVPLEGGEIVISLVNNRPSANNFSYSHSLQDWTRATNVRLRLLRTKTLLGHLMAVARQDPTVTRRYYYSIKDISIGGRCVCNGHADICDMTDPNDALKLVCRCRHNTCGEQCETCCPGFVQKPWRPATFDADNSCEPCMCYEHTTECRYDEEVARNKSSLDMYGKYEGGGVCINCQHNTAGINCELCKPGYYRPFGVALNSTRVCQRCRCDTQQSTGNCETGTGRCICRPQFTGVNCDRCNIGYFGYPRCAPCGCHINGTQGQQCEPTGGQCPCKPNFDGPNCAQCGVGYYNFPECRPCDCDGIGSIGRHCDIRTGQCRCRPNFGGRNCGQCAPGYYNYPACQPCNCDASGCTAEVCNLDNGQCICKPNFGGPRCDRCAVGYYRYPLCTPCGCSEVGMQSNECDASGQCVCKRNFMGRTCDQCAAGFYRYPECLPCNCDTYGSYGVSCDQVTGQCSCTPTFDGLTCNKCRPNYYNYPSCEECSCNPAGAKVVPGYPLGGCGAYSNGQLCECKERVGGRICDVCRPGYWNLNIENPDGCEDCGCNVGGTVGWSRACDVYSGQCKCRPLVNSRRCDECIDGTYSLQEYNAFGCQPCDCNVGGSQDQKCDKRSGQCKCKPRIGGRQCDSPIQTHYFPTLYHDMHELEDGHTPSGGAIRYGFDSTLFTGYSWRGYAIFSKIQDEVLIDVNIQKPGLYRIIYRYVNPTGQPIIADVTVTPETTSEGQQPGKAVFEATRQPQFVTVSTSAGAVSTFVLNPGQWTFSLKTSNGVLVDYMVLLPEAYYAATILQEKVHKLCTVPSTGDLCRHYTYVDVSSLSPTRCEGGFTGEGGRTQLYTDRNVLDAFSIPDMAHLNRRQTSLTIRVNVPRSGKYVLVLQYYTQVSNRVQELDAELSTGTGRDRGTLKLPGCAYSSLCRQPILDANRNPKEFNFDTNSGMLTITGRQDIDVAVESVIAIPITYWSFDYVTPQFVCLRKDGECLPGTFISPTGTIRVDLESPPNEDRVATDLPPSIIDLSVRVIKLDGSAPTVSIKSHVSNPGKYVLVAHYYQPYVVGFDVDVSLNSLSHSYKGTFRADYCPSVSGCRSIVNFRDVPDMQTIDINDQDIRILFNSSRALWLDYVMIIPAVLYEPKIVLDVQDVDKSAEFITKCGSQDFNINSSTTGFCRDGVYTLTMDYNNGALRCQCNPDGSSSFKCNEFGGQCPCKANIIGRTCSHCRTGYYGFPNCKQCKSPSGLCDPRTGLTICPPRVTGPRCDVCLPQTFGFDPLIGCEDCACSPNGVEGNRLDCDVSTGQCRCKPYVTGRRCDKCDAGYAGYPRCRPCSCDAKGVAAGICDQSSGNCLCKANVEGSQCSQCKPGSFYLEQRNAKGCTQCFCFGITTRCQQSQLRRSQISFMQRWGITNLKNPTIQKKDNTIEVKVESGDVIDPEQPIFWIAPQQYLGNKVTSYGGKLSYTVRFQIPRVAGNTGVILADVRLEGNNFTIIHTASEQPQPGTSLTVNVDLFESSFVHEGKGSPVTREQFMMVLARVRVMHIRASYYSTVSRVVLTDVRLDTTETAGSGEQASNVEQCECPPNYIGSSCEQCAPGYYRSKQGPFLGTCVPCQCQGRSDRCDPESGACTNCRDNFEGPQCLACRRGHYLDYNGICKICSCPLPIESNNFAYTCEVGSDGSTRSCQCMKGYRGTRCDSCEFGYWGNPMVPGGKCVECQCSGNINVRDPLSCDMQTGRCLKCINNAAGDHCERCQDWYYGDAVNLKDCQPCNCNKFGSELCDHQSGTCQCRPNVIGYTCDRCAPGAFGFESGRGCELCSCGAASLGSDCDAVTGQCRCRPGVTGRRCDQCEAGYWNYGPSGCQRCACMTDGAVTCDPATGRCQCLPGVTGPNCDRCLPRWVMITGVGCQECDNCVHLLVDDVEILQHNLTTSHRDLQTVSVGILAMRRLDRINSSVIELRPKVDRLTRTPTDPSSLNPLKRELASVQEEADKTSIKSDQLHREAEVIAQDAADVKERAEALYEEVVRAGVDAANDAVDFAKRVLNEIRSNIGQTNVEMLLRQAESMLAEIKRRDFSIKSDEAQEELARAIEALERAKNLLNKAMEQSNRTITYVERLTDIRRLLADLKSHSDQSMSNSQSATTINERNSNFMRTITELIQLIKETNEEIRACRDKSEELLRDARQFLDEARVAYRTINRELSRLDQASSQISEEADRLTSENIDLRPLVDRAIDHAKKLRQEADRLDSLIADTRQSAAAALNASNAYKSIIDAINKAWNASRAAVTAAEEAISKSTGHADEALRSKERSEGLHEDALEKAKKLEDDLRPRLTNVNQTLYTVNITITRILTQVTDIIKGLDRLPEGGYGDDAREASRKAADAQKKAEEAESKVKEIADKLPDDQHRVNQIPRDIDTAKRDIRDAQSEVNKVLDLVPTAVSLLDKLRIQADRIRRLGEDLRANISSLRSQVDVARDQANLIRVGVSFDATSQLRMRKPKNFLAAGSYTKVSMFFRTTADGLLAYIGPDVGTRIVDYMSIEVINGKVVFKFDLGSGQAVITSEKDVNDGEWREVIVERSGKNGKLTVRTENEPDDVQTGTALGTFSILDLSYNTKFYVGGVLDSARSVLEPSILNQARFTGCIEEVKFDGITVGPWNFEEAYNIKGCQDRNKLSELPPRSWEFGGSGYLVIAKGNFKTNQASPVYLDFRTFASEGLIFLMGQPKKDFLSIELRDGKILSQYDLGSGTASLQTQQTYNDGKWHRLYMNRIGNDGILKIDQISVASGRSPGSMKNLEIDPEIYIGGFRGQHTYPSVTQVPFKGCIQELQLGATKKDLSENIELKDVAPGCTEMVRMVSFRHDTSGGYIAVPSASFGADGLSIAQMSLSFKTLEKKGLIFYSADEGGAQETSAFTVSLNDGKVVVMHVVNGERLVLESGESSYDDGKWHYITITKDGRNFHLDIDDKDIVKGRITGRQKLTTNSLLYFGGIPSEKAIVQQHVGSDVNFIGCISDSMINQGAINFATASPENIRYAVFASCHIADPTPSPPPAPTRFSTRPLPALTTGLPPVQCKLPVEPVIDPAESSMSDGVRFGIKSDSRYEYNSLAAPFGQRSSFSIDFKTHEANGTLYYMSSNKHPDFIGLYMLNGHVGYAYNCGTGTGRALSDDTYNDGEWHTVKFTRNQKTGELDIDNEELLDITSPGAATSIELTPPFLLGGLTPDVVANASNNLGVSSRFVGCLRNFQQNNVDVKKPDFESSTEPCSSDAEHGTFFFSNGGHLVLYDSFSVPLDITIGIEIRPRILSGVIWSVFSHGSGPPGGDYLILQLVNGDVVFTMDNGQGEVTATFSPPARNQLCDGGWHTIRATKAKNVVMLEVDGVITAPGLGSEGVSHTNTNDPFYIGGLPEFHRGVKTRDQFVGCMRNLMIGTEPANLASARSVGSVNQAACPTT